MILFFWRHYSTALAADSHRYALGFQGEVTLDGLHVYYQCLMGKMYFICSSGLMNSRVGVEPRAGVPILWEIQGSLIICLAQTRERLKKSSGPGNHCLLQVSTSMPLMLEWISKRWLLGNSSPVFYNLALASSPWAQRWCCPLGLCGAGTLEPTLMTPTPTNTSTRNNRTDE